jgi:hypothetical protein
MTRLVDFTIPLFTTNTSTTTTTSLCVKSNPGALGWNGHVSASALFNPGLPFIHFTFHSYVLRLTLSITPWRVCFSFFVWAFDVVA